MEIIGIIAEFNPFHNGHLYYISKIKEMHPDSIVILVLNGYFLQRGEMSCQTKEDKTTIAMKANVDIVLELPVLFGTQSADIFAHTAVSILNYFHINTLIFGSEINNPLKILELAKKQTNKDFDQLVKQNMDKGINYPTAIAKALDMDFEYTPNDLLGISYAKCIIKEKYKIQIETIKRTNDYHDLDSNDSIISASNIRNKIKNKTTINKYMPDYSYQKVIHLNELKLYELLKYKIINEPNLKQYLDVDEGIDALLRKNILIADNIEALILKTKSKRYTYNKIRRMLTHILLGITKLDAKEKISYINVLGFNDKGLRYLNSIKKDIKIPLKKDYNSIQYKKELQASLIYDLLNNTNTYSFEKKNKPIKNI
jgi:predicted nucleotidyltransferase